MKFRKKPVVIEAIQYLGLLNIFEVVTFIEGKKPNLSAGHAFEYWDTFCQDCFKNGLPIRTLEDGPLLQAKHIATLGDWIIKGIAGEFYPCKPAFFAATYDVVEE